MLTLKHQQEVVYDLSNCVVDDDLKGRLLVSATGNVSVQSLAAIILCVIQEFSCLDLVTYCSQINLLWSFRVVQPLTQRLFSRR